MGMKKETVMETILGLCIGVGLSAACGFRVFVPLLVMSIATMMGWFEPSKGFEWLALPSVCLALGVATVCEVAAYYIPWVDNALDTVATPAAMIAGTLATMAVSSGEMSQFASWAAAIIVGGGTAGVVQMSTVAARSVSTATNGWFRELYCGDRGVDWSNLTFSFSYAGACACCNSGTDCGYLGGALDSP